MNDADPPIHDDQDTFHVEHHDARAHDASMLFFAGPHHVGRIAIGLRAVLWAIMLQFVMVMILWGVLVSSGQGAAGGPMQSGLLASDLFIVIAAILSVAVNALALWGWWRFTEPDPAHTEGSSVGDARWLIRASVVASIVCDACVNVLGALAPAKGPLAPLLLLLMVVAALGTLGAFTTRFFASIVYVRRLAARIPDPQLERRAQMAMWACPLAAVFAGWMCGIGLLIALVIYFNLLEQVRRALLGVRAQQAEYDWEMVEPDDGADVLQRG